MRKIECFKIKLFKTNSGNLFDLQLMDQLYEIRCDSNFMHVSPTVINADPFLFSHNGKLYLFYESKKLCKPGVIKMTWTKDLRTWARPVIVLQEPFHLSFPFVFEDNGAIYMIPESQQNHSIRLYRASDLNLNTFIFEKELISRDDESQKPIIDFSDTVIYKKNDHYFLFTTVNYDGENILHLYYAESLLEEYKLHKLSPVTKSNKTGRNAGSLLENNHAVYRFAQDCVAGYGENVNLMRIDSISIDDYKEHVEKENIIPLSGFHKHGGHQYNVAVFNGDYIVATDAKEYHNFVLARIWRRLIK